MPVTLLQFDAANFDGDTVSVAATSDKAAYYDVTAGRLMLVYPDGADEYAAVTRAVEMPAAYAAGALVAKIGYLCATASGLVDWEVYVEAVTDADATALSSGTTFDAANVTAATVGATVGHLDVASITLANKDSVAAGDMVRFLVRRDSDDGTNDTAAGNAYLLWLAIQE